MEEITLITPLFCSFNKSVDIDGVDLASETVVADGIPENRLKLLYTDDEDDMVDVGEESGFDTGVFDSVPTEGSTL